MKVLIIYPTPTHPVNAGNKQWVLAQVELLRKLECDVYMLCVNVRGIRENYKANKDFVKQTKDYWGDHVFIYDAGLLFRYWSTICMFVRKNFFKGYYNCDDLYPWGLTNFVGKICDSIYFDACIVNYYWLSKVLSRINIPIRAINTHDVFSLRDIVTHSRTAWMCTTPNEEAKALKRANNIFALQDEEAIFFKHLSPASQVFTVYCPFQIHDTKTVGTHNIVMLASSNTLNVKGFEWFVNNIFSEIVSTFPDCNLVIGGYLCNVLGKYQDYPHVKLIGAVGSPSELYDYGDIAINPCTDGTGLKIKTFEALSYGKIAMTHPHSVTGIFEKEKSPVFYSDIANEWVSYLKRVWRNPELLKTTRLRSIEYIERMNRHIEEEYKRFLGIK